MFIFIVACYALKPGDDPYKLLNIPHNANKEQIKQAFKEKTVELFPDLNKHKNTQNEWILVNEAYEVLNDPDRKARYDKYGRFDEEIKKENADKQNPGSYRFFESEDYDIDKRGIKDVTVINFDDFIKDEGEYMLLVYSSVLCKECNEVLELFDMFRQDYIKTLKCGGIDAAVSSELAKSLGAKVMPSVIYISIFNGKRTISVSNGKITSFKFYREFLEMQYKCELFYLTTLDQLNDFLIYDSQDVHVVQFGLTNATVQFRRMANRFGDKMKFGIYTKCDKRVSTALNLDTCSSIAIFKNPYLKPIKINKNSPLEDQLSYHSKPVYWYIDYNTFKVSCEKYCFIRCGEPSSEEANGLQSIPFSIGVIYNNDRIAKQLNIYEGEYVFVMIKENSYIKVPQGRNQKIEVQKFIKEIDTYKKLPLPDSFGPRLSFDDIKYMILRFLRIFSGIDISSLFKYAIIAWAVYKYIHRRLAVPANNRNPNEKHGDNSDHPKDEKKDEENQEKQKTE